MARGQLLGDDDAQEQSDEVAEALAAVGLVAESAPPLYEEFHLWPEHWPAFQLFNRLQTQWTYGPMGPVGLNWPSVRSSPAFYELGRDNGEQVLSEVEVMERAYLSALWERQAARKRDR